jgi:hypothetical protein
MGICSAETCYSCGELHIRPSVELITPGSKRSRLVQGPVVVGRPIIEAQRLPARNGNLERPTASHEPTAYRSAPIVPNSTGVFE